MIPTMVSQPLQIRTDMEKVGFTRLAANLGIKTLLKEEMLEVSIARTSLGDDYRVYRLTDQGTLWLSDNKDMLKLIVNEDGEDDVPF